MKTSVVLFAFILLAGCGGSSSGGAVASATQTGSATVSWTPPLTRADGTTSLSMSEIGGYIIFYGPTADSMTGVVVVSSANTTQYKISGLTLGTYYFAVSAFDSTPGLEGPAPGLEGPRSAPVAFTVQ